MNINIAIEFDLPEPVKKLAEAAKELRELFKVNGKETLKFTLDGKLVGDIGEALAARHFGVNLTGNNSPDHDGVVTINGSTKTVQVKASGRGVAAFRPPTRYVADYLLVFKLDYENMKARVVYNGPECKVREKIERILERNGKKHDGQHNVPFSFFSDIDQSSDDKLQPKLQPSAI